MEKLHNPTLRVIKILNLINDYEEGISFIGISENLNIPKSTLSPILRTLEDCEYIEKNSEGCYMASFRLFQLGLSYSGNLDALSMIRKHMQIVVDKINEIVQFGVLVEDKVLYLEKVNTTGNNIEIVSSVGKKLPAIYTGLGKALLSGYAEEEIVRMYKNYNFIKYTKNSIGNLDELLYELNLTRKNGYAVDNEELTSNITCIAVPIRQNGIVKGAISVTYPIFRKKDNKDKEIITALLDQQSIIEEVIKVQKYNLDFVNINY